PGLVNKAILASCPCELPQWRQYMGSKQPGFSAWKDSVNSVSPESVIGRISKNTSVLVVCGEKDETTPVRFSKRYYERLRSDGVNARFVQIPGQGHEIFFSTGLDQAIDEFLGNEVDVK
ncbi:MAG TPA: alpha/beta hydrolase, partial [Puia sp.]|nr:alpha/beta hydrolase [Puia sp.]